MTLDGFRKILIKLNIPVFHSVAVKKTSNYIIWQEVRKGSLRAEGTAAESYSMVAVDFFTKDEFSVIPERLENIFAVYGIPFTDANIDYGHETGYTCYSWTAFV